MEQVLHTFKQTLQYIFPSSDTSYLTKTTLFMHFTCTTKHITPLARLYYGDQMFIFSPTTINS